MEMRNMIFLSLIVLQNLMKAESTDLPTPIHVGVILDMQTWVAKVSNSSMYMAISDFYDLHPHYKTRLRLHTRDSTSDVIGAAFAGAKLISYLSKFMVIIWVILIHGLVSNYMVSLSSMLTLEREPAIIDFNDLVESGDNVGYRQGSFVVDLLKRFHFKESKLKSYSSPEECHELLSKGTKNGGVAAVFDEMPYINIFLAKYRSLSLYTKVGPTHKTDGYGFVFPLGSPIVSDMSNAVLEVTEGKTLMDNAESWHLTNKTTTEEIGWAVFSSRNHINHLQIIVSFSVLFLLMASSMFKEKQS